MERSEQIGELIAALAKAQAEFTPALKESSNPYYNSKYADLAAVIGAVRPALNKHGIALVQVSESDLERQTASVTTSLHFLEQWIAVEAEAPAVGKTKDGKDRFDIQTIGAAWKYLRRYTLEGCVGLASEDDDGNTLVREDSRSVPAKRVLPRSEQGGYLAPAESVSEAQLAEYRAWGEAFNEADTLEKFNATVVPLMKDRGKDFIKAAAQVAKNRGYTPNRETGFYEEKTNGNNPVLTNA